MKPANTIRIKLLPFLVSMIVPMLLLGLQQVFASPSDRPHPAPIAEAHPPAGTPTPLSGYRLPFDRRFKSLISNGPGEGLHTGKSREAIDFAPIGWNEVLAAKAGTIYINRQYGDWGYLVIIAHDDGFHTYYAHLNGFGIVGERTPVTQGQTIGIVGASGWATGVHLHFEARDQMTPTPNPPATINPQAANGGDSTNPSVRMFAPFGNPTSGAATFANYIP